MRAILATLILLQATASGWAASFDLRENGQLKIYPVGEWLIVGEDFGEFRIRIGSKRMAIKAVCTIHVTMNGPDTLSTEGKLTYQLMTVAGRLIATGKFEETKPVLKPLYRNQGFGYYYLLTERKLEGQKPLVGDYKLVCLGLIRMSSKVMVRFQILSDGEETEPFQQLLGMVEGMELVAQ